MDNSLHENIPHGQVNPGQTDPAGNDITIKKNEGISDQGNEWSDEEGVHADGEVILGEKAEKYIKESGNIEDLPDEEDEKNAETVQKSNKEKNSKVTGDQKEEDEVVERKEDYVPGYDLGRNKVQ